MSYPDRNPTGTGAGGAGVPWAPATGPGGVPGQFPGPAGPPPAPPWSVAGPGPSYPTNGGFLRPGTVVGAVPPAGSAPPPNAPQLDRQPSRRADPARLLGLAVAVLGAVNFCFGFLPEVSAPRLGETLSVYAVGPAYVPILLLIAGLLALAAFLPGSERSRLAVAAVSVGGAVGAIVSLGTPGSFELFANPNQVSAGLGAILLVVFGIVQAVVAIAAYVVGSDTPWSAARPAAGSPAAGGANPASPAGVGPSLGGAPVGYPAASGGNVTGSAGPGRPVDQPPPGWIPLATPPPEWPRPDDRATGPQVVVGTEAVRPDQAPRDSLSTSDTGPIPVVDAESPVSLSKNEDGA